MLRREDEFILPALRPRTQHAKTPLCYEETRPVTVQKNVHQCIINLGNDIRQRLYQTAKEEHAQAINLAENALWERAMEMQRAAVQKAEHHAKNKHAERVRQLKEENKLDIKAACKRVKDQHEFEVMDRVAEERHHGDERLQAAVGEVETRCALELKKSVELARQEERRIADRKITDLVRQFEKKALDDKRKSDESLQRALAELSTEKDAEKATAIEDATSQVKNEAKEHAEVMSREHGEQMRGLHAQLSEQRALMVNEKRSSASLASENEVLLADIAQLRAHFERFVNVVKPFNSEFAAGFVVPPLIH